MHRGLEGMPVVIQVLQIKWHIEMVIDLLVATACQSTDYLAQMVENVCNLWW